MSRIAIFYDTETTGFPLWGEPSNDPRQPHIVELAAIRRNLDDATDPVQTLHAIIKPDGWTISEEVAKIHGVTQEKALAEGRPEAEVITEFEALWRTVDCRIAFNESFDARIMRIAFKRFIGQAKAEEWSAGKAKCAAILATPICNLPPTDRMKAVGFGWKPKKPKLTEAYQFFFNKPLEGAHGAVADCQACSDVYDAIVAHHAGKLGNDLRASVGQAPQKETF